MEIFHGGYFKTHTYGRKKYFVPRFNKRGGKTYLDGLDPDKFSWVELNNIAWDLGYRELPISYHFKLPSTEAHEGLILIKGDGECMEMMKMIPKQRQITVYITGGGRRKYDEALADQYVPSDPDWENPLNRISPREAERVHFEANLMASQLYSSVEVFEGRTVVGEYVIDLTDVDVDVFEGRTDMDEDAEVGVGEEVNVEVGVDDVNQPEMCPSAGTFGNLSDILGHGALNIGDDDDAIYGHDGKRIKREVVGGKGFRVKHLAHRPMPVGYKDQLAREIEKIERREREAAKKKEREEIENLRLEEESIRESQASVGLSREETEQRAREKEENEQREREEQAVREEAEKKEREAAEKRAVEACKVRTQQSGPMPQDARYNTRKRGKKPSTGVVEEFYSTDDSDYYVDSDYDLEHDEDVDDVQFKENVIDAEQVPEYVDMGYDGYCSDEHAGSDELESLSGSDTEEDADGNHVDSSSFKVGERKIIPWIRSVDIKNPIFRINLAFPNLEQCREAVREHAIRNHSGLWFKRNNRKKIEVRRQWGCRWRMYASRVRNFGETMVVKTLFDTHTCSPVETSHFLTYRRIAEEVKDALLADENWSRQGIAHHILDKFKLDVGVQTISRAKRCARRINEGHYIEQYNQLASYQKELLRSNPGSTVVIKTQMDGPVRRFQRMYMCFKAQQDGWKAGCRPLICLDGCHIKGHHPGELLTAVGIDANNGMYPIAYALVEIEDQATWTWFLDYLKCDLGLENIRKLVFMSDKQKGLENAIKALYPYAEHRNCVRHLYNNFKGKNPGEGLKQLMWNAARSSTQAWYNKHMDDLKMLSEDAFNWFHDKPPRHWSRAFFVDYSKCDILLNNLCESFNHAILPCRDKPVRTMFEKLRMDMMVRNANRRVACEKWKGVIGPRIKKIIDKTVERVTLHKVHRSTEYSYQVTGTGESGSKHAVDLGLHTCTCRRWQLSGIPCVHALCAIRFKKQDPTLYCDDYLMASSYLQTYTPAINPIAGEDDWEQVDFPIAPPPYKKQVGRPKMKRTKEAGEKNKGMAPPAPIQGKLGLQTSRTGIKITCGICKQQGHNKIGCPITKAKKIAAGEGQSSGASTKKRVRAKVTRAAAPSRACNIKDQVIKSAKGWYKRKAAEEGDGSSSTQPQHVPTQGSQNNVD